MRAVLSRLATYTQKCGHTACYLQAKSVDPWVIDVHGWLRAWLYTVVLRTDRLICKGPFVFSVHLTASVFPPKRDILFLTTGRNELFSHPWTPSKLFLNRNFPLFPISRITLLYPLEVQRYSSFLPGAFASLVNRLVIDSTGVISYPIHFQPCNRLQ